MQVPKRNNQTWCWTWLISLPSWPLRNLANFDHVHPLTTGSSIRSIWIQKVVVVVHSYTHAFQCARCKLAHVNAKSDTLYQTAMTGGWKNCFYCASHQSCCSSHAIGLEQALVKHNYNGCCLWEGWWLGRVSRSSRSRCKKEPTPVSGAHQGRFRNFGK